VSTVSGSTLAERWAESLSAADPLPGPPWLLSVRDRAAGEFRTSGLPHRKVEAWKYTPMKVLEDLAPELPRAPEDVTGAEFPESLIDTAPAIHVTGGWLTGLPENLPAGVSISPLAEGIRCHEGRLRPMIERTDIAGPARALTALNTALLGQGVVIHVAKDTLAGPLYIRWAFAGQLTPVMGQFCVFVLLDEGARLDLVDHFETRGGAGGALNLVCHADLGAGAVLSQVRVQAESETSALFTSTVVRQGPGSRYAYWGFDIGGRLARHEWDVRLAGSGAAAEISGAFILDGSRYADNHVSISHEAGDCRSDQFFRGVLGGRSRGVFNGRALIQPGADGSNVRQSNANLLLSRLAEMDTKPELEIYADDVEASHGATVGQLDENAVFYLRSRGLSDGQARRMLTTAFCHAVTDRLEDRQLAGRIAALMDAAMPVPDGTGAQEG